ncbi:hypothetical protein ACFFQF_05865 [Haladaptatus pallidirubidus]|uniref:Uncharacterized protein n=1 Tax=Haladaptatus pallidirubidus TaxID=1008152 RepID=A0AAV3ULV5_9EURY|nr:hypothetical protein [Haladaptatus pallidirubidus]
MGVLLLDDVESQRLNPDSSLQWTGEYVVPVVSLCSRRLFAESRFVYLTLDAKGGERVVSPGVESECCIKTDISNSLIAPFGEYELKD